MSENPLLQLEALGQSIWMDFIRRGTITSGELDRLIQEDGLSGVTSNPSIFEKAVGGSHDYDDQISELSRAGKPAEDIYQAITVKDIQDTADHFRPVFDRKKQRDGFVSLEVSPHLAHDTQDTIQEARRLWQALSRPNVMIKVPATQEGIPAIRQLISEGINVNITLLFGLPRYQEVIEAYLSGLEARLERGEPIDRIASVASFFLSRIDVLLDPVLEKLMAGTGSQVGAAEAAHGQIAIASARVAYQIFQKAFGNDRFRRLAAKGAGTQRLLWASTSTKNPAYSDVMYVEALIGPDTINTLPLETINAYRDHGHPEVRLTQDLDQAHRVLDSLSGLGIDLDKATQQLEDEGVDKFNQAFDKLMKAIQEKRQATIAGQVDRQSLDLGSHMGGYQKTLDHLNETQFMDCFWRKDPSLWKEDPQAQELIQNSLGWLHVAEKMQEALPDLLRFTQQVHSDGFTHVVHMGMGGSSLAPLVFQETYPVGKKGIPLTVLDTTDPETILGLDRTLPLEKTLFIVASKSGTTTEPIAFEEYFYSKVYDLIGDRAGGNFVAITDPGTPLEASSRKRGYRRVFTNFKDIGGRYSALSYFGLVPAALMGLDVGEILNQAERMQHACDSCVDTHDNPGLTLGAALGTLGNAGVDKVTIITPERAKTLGMWLEQLIAESTGKEGKGLLPVAGEPLGRPEDYGEDRVFVYFHLRGVPDGETASRLAALKSAGYPIITIQLDSLTDLAQEFYRWEVATAVAGAVLGINPFDQPNVQESKDNTNHLLKAYREKGRLPEEPVALVEGPLSVSGGQKNTSLPAMIAQFLRDNRPGDYIAILAYLPESAEMDSALQSLRDSLREKTRLATTTGYGPRYLHSTGQYHKGGPNTGIFIVLTVDEPAEVQIPGEPYTFNILNRAQALGDLEALRKHERRVLHVHLDSNAPRGITALQEAINTLNLG